MANPATLYRFRIDLSDVDRSVYETIDVRAAKHPSETVEYLLTRVLAYALNYAPGLRFSPGLCLGDEPALQLDGEHGRIALWVDIGSPSPRKLHKATKAAQKVRVYTYKDPQSLLREIAREEIHQPEKVEVFALALPFLQELARELLRDNDWTLIHQDGELSVSTSANSCAGTVVHYAL